MRAPRRFRARQLIPDITKPAVDLSLFGRAACGLLLSCFAAGVAAQELQPRAYIPAPVGLNFFGVGYSNNAGGLLFDPSLPVEDSRVNANTVTLAFGQTFSVQGRTAQALAILPYVEANLDGLALGAPQHRYLSGLGDVSFRYAMNLYGAPAMHLKEYASYRQKTIVGVSVTVTAPSGQYDPNRLINIGTNRWGFKPELGISRAVGKWTVEGAAGVWLYTSNQQFTGSSTRTQVPLGSLQGHVVRFLPHRAWLAGDWTFFTGGRTRVDERDNANYLGGIRLGATLGISLSRRHAIKLSYFDGVLSRAGADTRSIGISYNIVWLLGR